MTGTAATAAKAATVAAVATRAMPVSSVPVGASSLPFMRDRSLVAGVTAWVGDADPASVSPAARAMESARAMRLLQAAVRPEFSGDVINVPQDHAVLT